MKNDGYCHAFRVDTLARSRMTSSCVSSLTTRATPSYRLWCAEPPFSAELSAFYMGDPGHLSVRTVACLITDLQVTLYNCSFVRFLP